jgi:hypothetical protein
MVETQNTRRLARNAHFAQLVLIPVFYAMREQFLLEEITWLPPIDDQPQTFSGYGMTSEYQKMFLIQDRLLGDMIRVVCPEQSWELNKSEW